MTESNKIFELVRKLTNPASDQSSPAGIEAAIRILRSAIQDYSGDFRFRNKLAHVFILNEQYAEAEKILPESDNDWGTLRLRLDLYRNWIGKDSSLDLLAKCDALMAAFATATRIDSRDSQSNFRKFKPVIGFYINLGRYRESIDLLGRLGRAQPALRAAAMVLIGQAELLVKHTSDASVAAPPPPARLNLKNTFVAAILNEIRGLEEGKDITANEIFGRRHKELYLPGDDLIYADAIQHYVAGNSTASINLLRPLFVRNVFDPFAAIIFMACSDRDSDLQTHMKKAFGISAYRRLHRIAIELVRRRSHATKDDHRIRTSTVSDGLHPEPVNRQAVKILKSKAFRP